MGKASRWIRNFLIGKKEDRKKNDASFSVESQTTKSESVPGTPKVKRKWSFGKASGKEATHKFSKSFDSIDPSKLPIQAVAKSESQKSHTKAMVAIRGQIEYAAATKIQSVFRSYLARKALHALRGLVKLQASVRGHLVRKQTTDILKRMHALMAIQVRARVQRIQLAAAEEAQYVVKTRSSFHKGFIPETGVRALQRDRNKLDTNPNETRLVSKSSSGYLNHSQMERIDTTINNSGHLSISKRHQYEEHSFRTAENPTRTSFIHQQPNFPNPTACNDHYSFLPNYMANTESSKAKYRSQSEPKQRPKWNNMKQKTKHTEIMDAIDISMDDQILKPSNSQFRLINGLDKHDPWFLKLYKTRRTVNDSNYDSISTSTGHSNYFESLAAYEVGMCLALLHCAKLCTAFQMVF
ncbi:hypothetical protein FEM48_Zijuj02G0162000 [Ziziphus jujuba var. spinosa]|uniref:DUF4005 domain-containing protein n=1 Tax=Ziziphus jujuba var. spinosa TaxID=714518 RepID=A0A978VWN3_ZIZJJ|nr:hypothetical protein FEM48_Zijuj02G0162000 [Ziziphus jujuba var. spinosa]